MDAMLNWLWQGTIVAVATEAVLRLLTRRRAAVRYGLAWTACLGVLALPIAPAVRSIPSGALAVAPVAASAGHLISIPATWWTSGELVFALWVAWSIGQITALAGAARSLRRVRARCTPCPPDLDARLPVWSGLKQRGRPASLLVSPDVSTAAVLGFGSPLIGIAPDLPERLGGEDLDRVIAHEWAHVQRRDDLAQFAQRIVRVIAGWHPAVWWLERRIDLEREIACDEIAIGVTGSPKAYASCLTTLAAVARPLRGLPAPAVVATRGLRQRVVSILETSRRSGRRRMRGTAALFGVALFALVVLVGNVRIIGSAAVLIEEDVVRPLAAPLAATRLLPSSLTTVPAPPNVNVATASSARAERERRPVSVAFTAGISTVPSGEPMFGTSTEPPAALGPAAALPDGSLEPLRSRRLSVGLVVDEAPRPAQRATHPADSSAEVRAPWDAAADAGIAIGRKSRDAGVATAGFFTRLSQKIVRSF